ncbi:MAG TPA: flagellar motor switch protein FliN [Spirochaetia bacterium]|nr:flagellar motor switch protein FliN [Spirochaetia bacterium]
MSGTAKEGPGKDPSIKKAVFPSLSAGGFLPQMKTGLDHFMDVEMELTAEIGARTMAVREVLGLDEGSVITLDRAAGETMSILLNGRPFARGEVVVINDRLAVRVTHVEQPLRLRQGESHGQ